jgi:hypothetical protein
VALSKWKLALISGSPALSKTALAFRSVWHRIEASPGRLCELGAHQSSRVRENQDLGSVPSATELPAIAATEARARQRFGQG